MDMKLLLKLDNEVFLQVLNKTIPGTLGKGNGN